GRTRGRRDANKDVRGTLTKSRVVGADERVACCRERRVSSVSGTKGVPELDGRVGDKPARPSRFLRGRLACNTIPRFVATAPQRLRAQPHTPPPSLPNRRPLPRARSR